MSPLEIKKHKVEFLRVSAAKAEMEYIIDQRLDEIDRIKANIDIQQKRMDEISNELSKNNVSLGENTNV